MNKNKNNTNNEARLFVADPGHDFINRTNWKFVKKVSAMTIFFDIAAYTTKNTRPTVAGITHSRTPRVSTVPRVTANATGWTRHIPRTTTRGTRISRPSEYNSQMFHKTYQKSGKRLDNSKNCFTMTLWIFTCADSVSCISLAVLPHLGNVTK